MPECFGQQRLLDVMRDGDFALQALALAVFLYQAGVVEDARGLQCQRLQNLPLQSGKCGGAATVEIEHAKEVSRRCSRAWSGRKERTM